MSELSEREDAGENGRKGEREIAPSPLLRFPLSSLLWLLPPVLFALWLYRRALGFAYFNDDPTGHFAWMEGQTLLGFFAGSASYGYYRPVVFAVLRLSEMLFGNAAFPHNPVADHALLLLLHAANVALVWALARRLGGRSRLGRQKSPPGGRNRLQATGVASGGGRAFATVAALLFAAVPFSYEAVAYVASLTHPLVVFWTLLALLLYDRQQDTSYEIRDTDSGVRRQPSSHPATGHWPLATDHSPRITDHWPFFASLLALTLGLLTHENGLFIFPALVGLDWVRRPRQGWRDRAARLWPFAVPPVLFAVVWLAIPKNSEQGLNSLADVGRNLVPFLQTLIYPLLPVIPLDAGDVWPLIILAVAALAALGLLAWRAGMGRVWAYALGWFVLASLPALLFLGPAYVYGSPRLSYLPSIGVALLWALPVWWLYDRRQPGADNGPQTTDHRPRAWSESELVTPHSSLVTQNIVRRLSSVVLIITYTLAILLPPLPFIRCQLDFYDETSRFARGMASVADTTPSGRDIVFVNAPFFFSSTAARPEGCPSPYPWTPTGGILIPPYAQPRDFVRFNGGPDRPVTGVTYTGYAPGWRTFGSEIDGESLRAHAAAGAVFIFDLWRGTFSDLSAAWQPDAAPPAFPLVTFGQALALTGRTVEERSEQAMVRLEWRVLAETGTPLAAFVHVYDTTGALVAQSDGPPGNGLVPQGEWRSGDGLADERLIDLSGLAPGTYTVAVGVYDTSSGKRLMAAADGHPLPNDILPVVIIER